MGRTLSSILVLIVIVFVGALGYFYIQEGSFEGAGARMDDAIVEVADNTEAAVREGAEATGDFVDDMTDGDAQ